MTAPTTDQLQILDDTFEQAELERVELGSDESPNRHWFTDNEDKMFSTDGYELEAIEADEQEFEVDGWYLCPPEPMWDRLGDESTLMAEGAHCATAAANANRVIDNLDANGGHVRRTSFRALVAADRRSGKLDVTRTYDLVSEIATQVFVHPPHTAAAASYRNGLLRGLAIALGVGNDEGDLSVRSLRQLAWDIEHEEHGPGDQVLNFTERVMDILDDRELLAPFTN